MTTTRHRRRTTALALATAVLLPVLASPAAAVPAAAPAAGAPPSVGAGAAHAAGAHAAVLPTADDDTVTWAVQPADENGPDGRRWIELTLDPGQTVTEHVAVRNFGTTATTFALSAADGYLTDKGRFTMLRSDQESVDAGTWIDVQESVEVGPGATAVVPFTVTVPEGVTPGDHPAGIAASVTSTGSTVGVESRVGFRVMTRVTGEIQPSLAVTDVQATYTPSWNPFAPGEIEVDYVVENDGNIRLGASGEVTSEGPFGLGAATVASPPLEEVLPTGSQSARVDLGSLWPLGRVTTEVTLTPVPVGSDEIDAAALGPVTVTVTTWALPWPQLLLLALVVLVLLGVRDDRRRRRRRLDAMLARARAEARERALAETTGATASGE